MLWIIYLCLLIWLMHLVNGFERYVLFSCVLIPSTYIIEIKKYLRFNKATETWNQHQGLEFNLFTCFVYSPCIITYLKPLLCPEFVLSGTLFLFYMTLKIKVHQKFATPFLVVYILRQRYSLWYLCRFLWIRWRSPWNFLCNFISNKINFCFCCLFYHSTWFCPRGIGCQFPFHVKIPFSILTGHFSVLDKHP